ncbi:MAG: biotin-protein ligase [Bacillales bacterium]|jgi:BirA family biotin operon repressor/biotin-[acetyl-CoA-carboxylase] ligase|nr:biotin-protein ligase [Bacillales bacterium]
MSTKHKILELLEKNRGHHLSGEEIAKQLEISRSAVWKNIKLLEKDGYYIKAVTNQGYSLTDDNNILSVQGILPYLSNENFSKKIHIFHSLESTNKTAKEMAINGHEHGTVIISDSQTSGKGRYGRTFYSPSGSGLYMSFILRAEYLNLPTVPLITSATAVAVCRAIESVTGKEPKIKWVNDIVLENKKICGILTEAMSNFESGTIDWIIIGIGVNIDTNDFPDELKGIAGSLFSSVSEGTIRNRLAAEITNILLSSNDWLDNPQVYTEYKSRQLLFGKKITVIQQNETYEALALDLDEMCNLIVKKEDGTVVALSTGEVSIKNFNA